VTSKLTDERQGRALTAITMVVENPSPPSKMSLWIGRLDGAKFLSSRIQPEKTAFTRS
jgi:hypothetical protein